MNLRQGLICEYRQARDRIHRRSTYTEREWAGRILWCEGTRMYKKARVEDAPNHLQARVREILELVREQEAEITEARHP